jgi:hypothetical protein
MRGGTRTWALAAALVAAGAVLVAVRHGPALSLALAIAAPSLAPQTTGSRAEAAPQAVEIRGPSGILRADLYRPARESGAVLLVHGLSAAGGRHPELVRLAQALAARGQLVLVPQFDGMAAIRLGGQEVDEVRAALGHLRALSGSRTGIAGFSFGAGPALIAAADVPDVRPVGSFGGYADLRDVLVFVTTGVHNVGGQPRKVKQEEYNRWKLLALLAGFAEDGADRQRLAAIAALRLANPAKDTADDETRLGSEGRALAALATNRREDAVAALLAALPPRARRAMDALSPLPVMPRLAGRLLIAHGIGDETIPYTESLRLAAAAGPRERAIILETFHHAGPRPRWPSPARILDGWRLVQLTDGLLSP